MKTHLFIGLLLIVIDFSQNVSAYETNKDTLGVIYLFNRAHVAPSFLCSLAKYQEYIGTYTPSHIYIFTRELDLRQLKTKHKEKLQQFNNTLHFMKIPDSDWRLPNIAYSQNWTLKYTENYRAMGHWRLTFPFQFASERGYKYIMFIDDDTFIMSPLTLNIIDAMNEKSAVFAFPKDSTSSDLIPTYLLAEHTKAYIESRGITPQRLYEDCIPPNILGLRSAGSYSSGKLVLNKDGWRANTVYGNFMIISVDFWFQPYMQDYLNYTLTTGLHVIHRWNEQAVISMMRLLFTTSKQDLELEGFSYKHGHIYRNGFHEQRKHLDCVRYEIMYSTTNSTSR